MNNQEKHHKLELNSPAGDFDCLKAAVYNGADSVYLGTKLFNARRLANNFSAEGLKEAIKFAHLHGVKIYLVQNTLVKNEELNTWFKSLEQAYLFGIDAVIIQEAFFAPLIKKYFPGLRVHASTQASFMNWHAISCFEGLDLAVLARELTKNEISEIKNHAKTELEIFVHGHLCISYSGQCLISSLIGKRSGNRGICASSCRKQYNNQGYLISSKDLMLAENVDEIYSLGVNAIKIEGRMKDAEYVASATRIYRKQIDLAAAGASSKLTDGELDELKMGFNREFTSGFFAGNKSIVGETMPMNRGIYLGKIKNGKLRLESKINSTDGIGFWNPSYEGKLRGFVLGKFFRDGTEAQSANAGDSIEIPSRHFIDGTKVYKTSTSTPLIEKFREFKLNITGKLNEPLFFECGGIKLQSDSNLQEAKNQSISESIIGQKLEISKRLGITWKLSCNLESNLFLPISQLTKMAKDLENNLLEGSVPKRNSNYSGLPAISGSFPALEPRLLVKVYNISQLKEANEQKVYAIYYDVFNGDVLAARKLCTNSKFFLDTPVVLTDKDIGRIENIIAKTKPDGIVIGNWGALAIKFSGEKHGKYSLNIFNDISMDALIKKGVIPEVSVELNAEHALRMKNKNFIYYAHGQIPVMHFKGEYKEKSLTDEKQYTFPLRIVNGNTEMLYSRPIAAFEGIKKLIDGGVRHFVLDLNKDVTTIIRAYQSIIESKNPDLSYLKKGTTVGNFLKVVA